MYEAADIRIITNKTCATDVWLRESRKPLLKQEIDIAMLVRIEAAAMSKKLGSAEIIDMLAKLNIKNNDTARDRENMDRGMTLIFTSTSNYYYATSLSHNIPKDVV